MQKTRIIEACAKNTKSCDSFMEVSEKIIEMVNDHYFDLQMYANYVFDIDNANKALSDKNNFYNKIMDVQRQYNDKYVSMPLFTRENMDKLQLIIDDILKNIPDAYITAKEYMSDVISVSFFGSGAASSAILLKIERKFPDDSVMPLIVKLVPLQLPHHYNYLPFTNPEENNTFIQKYIESPSYAIFIKEAWMYCFSKVVLARYTPTFTCISNCYIIQGFPLDNYDELVKLYDEYAVKRIANKKPLAYKKWFNNLLDKNINELGQQQIINSQYGCFEMKQIEQTLYDVYKIPNSFTLSIIFEYLYTKVVTAFVSRIIFTDDHLDNVAFSTVDYVRHYKIKCNGCNYNFYMPPGKMVQFIDLERYVFNFSPYDIYTNTALKSIPVEDYNNEFSSESNTHFNNIRNQYEKNNFIFDKSLDTLLGKGFGKNNFEDPSEYQIMLKILTSTFIHDIKTFSQIMEANLPKKYLTIDPNTNIPVKSYFIDLDDDNLKIIDFDNIKNQI